MRRRATGQRALSLSPPLEYKALTDAGLQRPVGCASLPGEELDPCRRFGSRDQRDAPPATSVTKYVAEWRAFFDAERLCAIPVRRAIRARTSPGQTTVQQSQEKSGTARCRHSSCRQISESGWACGTSGVRGTSSISVRYAMITTRTSTGQTLGPSRT